MIAALRYSIRSRLPVIHQTEAAECGLACVAMIAAYHGFRTNLAAIRDRLSISLRGMNLRTLMRCAAELGLQSRPVRVGIQRLADLPMPCILHWEMNHYVVLKRVTRNYVEIHDPANGACRLKPEEVDRKFTGVALEIRPSPTFVEASGPRSYSIRGLLGPITGLRSGLSRVMLLTLFLETLALVTPFYMQLVIDRVLTPADPSLLVMLACAFSAIVVAQAAMGALREWSITALSVTVNFQWMGNTFAHLMRLPYDWFQKRQLGDVLTKFGAISSIQRAVTTESVRALFDGALAAFTLGLMLKYNVQLTMVSVCLLTLYISVKLAPIRQLQACRKAELDYLAKQSTSLLETVRGIQAVRLAGRVEERKSAWLNALEQQYNAELRGARIRTWQQLMSSSLSGLERIMVIALGVHLVTEGNFTLGALLAFLAYRELFSSRITALMEQIISFRLLRVQTDRVADIVLSRPEESTQHDAASGGEDCACQDIKIGVRDARFAYSRMEPEVVRGVTFTVGAGECVAITGPSGCGKTTLLKMIVGLLKPTSGAILINDVDIRQFGYDNYRGLVGCVMQDDALFSGTILDNISFFDPDIDKAHVWECAMLAAIHDEIMSMPMTYNTLVADIGVGLSGGQKQRILLARALYRKPRILVLDEATSHLDLENERKINRALGDLALTRIIVAHRPESIAIAHRIIRLEQQETLSAGVRA